MHANLNRDAKKQRKPYSAADFCFFVDHEENRPEARAASIYMALVKAKRLPGFALPFFSDFKHGEPSKAPLEQVVMLHPEFVFLDPQAIEGGFIGTMIAEHSVSGKTIEVEHMDQIWTIQVPEFEDYILAKNLVEIDVVMPPQPIARE